MEYITQNIYDLYQEVKYNHVWNVHTIKDFSVIQSKIVYKVIHAEKNKTLLQNMPHTLYLDFAIVFYVLFEADESGTATIPITNELLHLWNTTTETLQKMGFHLGKFIYLMDAYLDFKEDLKKQLYNPLVTVDLKNMEDILETIMTDCVSEYTKLPVDDKYKEILDNVLYAGIWSEYDIRNVRERKKR